MIRAVVFRDGHSPHIVKEEPTPMYSSLANYAACNGPEGAVSPGAAAAAAVAAVAQGNRVHFLSLLPVDEILRGATVCYIGVCDDDMKRGLSRRQIFIDYRSKI